MDNKTLREIMGFGDEVVIDEEAHKFLEKKLKGMMGYDDDEHEMTPRDIEELKERMRKQNELFD